MFLYPNITYLISNLAFKFIKVNLALYFKKSKIILFQKTKNRKNCFEFCDWIETLSFSQVIVYQLISQNPPSAYFYYFYYSLCNSLFRLAGQDSALHQGTFWFWSNFQTPLQGANQNIRTWFLAFWKALQ